jgi:hypothetical protein
MAWTASGIFRAFLTDTLAGTAVFDLNAPSDTYKVALYDNDITPDKDATSANTAYNAGAWTASGNEVSDGAEWASAGVALDSATITNPTTNVVMFDAADEVSGSSATLANVYGCLIYNDTKTTPVADQGVCHIYFGGTNSVTDGTLTVSWNASGLFRITV